MDNIFKTILFIIGGITVFMLFILLLPVLILVYLFLPKKSSKTWMNTFAQQAKNVRGKRKKSPSSSGFETNIPASEDIIDVNAKEVNDNNN